MDDAQNENLLWFKNFRRSAIFKKFRERPIAYFCAEYALNKKLPTYAGGLGVLAGDIVNEAADQKIPFIAVGLMYHKKYYEGSEGEIYDTPDKAGFSLVPGEQEILTVSVPIEDRMVYARAWQRQIGAVSIYLLDTDLPQNNPSDRAITEQLYTNDKETRLKQHIVLGICGLKMLKALKIHPSVYHLNEGHSAMLSLELIRHEMEERKISFDEAKQFAKRRIVFTNHTIVNVGSDVYSDDLVALTLSKYAEDLKIPVKDIINLGLVQESSAFSITMLSLRMAGIINAVSKLHAKRAKEIWTSHPMVAITNGVHFSRWNKIKDSGGAEPNGLWREHQKNKHKLLSRVNKKIARPWKDDELVVGWARRLVGYKRPLALFEDIEKLKKIALNHERPVKFLISGMPPPNHEESRAIYEQLKKIINDELSGIVVFLPNYNLEIAELMTSGCDVWLNTPVLGFEACGTSGMKAALNGVLPLTVPDGWAAETEMYKVGWTLDDAKITESILDKIKDDIAPLYYARNTDNIPQLWQENMENARKMVLSQFTTTRALRQYIELLYY